MRILEIVHWFPPHVGGIERYVYNLSKSLVSQGHEVTVLTTLVPNSAKTEMVDGIRVLRYYPWLTIFRNPITPGMLFPHLEFRQFNVIHTHVYYSFAAITAVALKRFLKKPLVITCHGNWVYGNWLLNMVGPVYRRIFGKYILVSADRIIALSQSEKRQLTKLGICESKIHVIPNAVDLALWNSYMQNSGSFSDGISKCLQDYSSENKKVILFVGSIIKRKGIQYLIEALPLVFRECPDSVCLFVGEGDFRKKAQNLIVQLGMTSKVCFTGALSGLDLASAYKSASVYVLPSLGEGLPTTMMETAVFSKPMVATNIDGIYDYFSDVAVLIEPKNSVALAKAIIKILQDQNLAEKLGNAARRLIERKLNWETQVNHVIKLLEECEIQKR